MNDEEKKAIDILQNCIADYVIGEYCEKCGDRLVCNDRNEDCYFQQAIDTVVNLIEKQEKVIDKMIEHTVRVIINDDNACLLPFCDNEDNLEEKVKKYFYREAKDE